MTPRRFYHPTDRGLEGKIAARLESLRARDAEYRRKQGGGK